MARTRSDRRGGGGALARLDRNESPFGTADYVLSVWEKQRTADPRRYGLNRYGDFFQSDMLAAIAGHHGLTFLNVTPCSGTEEAGTVLAAALLRHGGELVQPVPTEDPISRPARAWGARVRTVALDPSHRQDLAALAAAVGAETKLVHVQNPHNPSGRSIGAREFEGFLAAVAARNPDTYVWVDEAYAPYSTRSDFPDSFNLIRRALLDSKLIVSRSLSTAHGVAGAPTAYLAGGQALTEETEGVTNGFFVPDAYGWAGPEAGVSRMGEKALIALLGPAGDRLLAKVRRRNEDGRDRLVAMLARRGFDVVPSDSSFVLARAPGRFARGGLGSALGRRGVLVRSPWGWGSRYRGFVRISVGGADELDRLEAALDAVLRRPRRASVRPRRRGTTAAAPPVAAAGGLLLPAIRRAGVALERAPEPRLDLSRRDFVRRAGLGAAGAALLAAGLSRTAQAFPPDSYYDTFNLARMIYHENPVGPSPAALEAVREVIALGPTAARLYQDNDAADLVDEILAYNRERRPSTAKLGPGNVMLTQGSAEGLYLSADTFVAGGTLVGEWPAYRIIRERVWQQDGTVVDVPLRADDSGPDYEALKQALHAHPGTGLIHFNVQNNPVGPVLRRDEFDAFAAHVYDQHPNTIIVADESDAEFVETDQVGSLPDFAAHVAADRNLVHLQTFSHVFGLTGLRVGYLMASPRLISRMRQKRIVHPISVFGHAAALASLRDRRAQIDRCHAVCDEGRRYIYGELDKLGLHYVRSQGQYVFFDTGLSGTAIWLAMIGEGVLTRYGREWGRESWMRVNPGLPDENERFIGSLKAVLAQPDLANLPEIPVRLPLPGASRENQALARGLRAGLLRDTFIQSRMPPLERPFRTTPASVFRR